MPGFNQTGPMGQGPMTGRRMGRCTNWDAIRKNQITAENEKSKLTPTENEKLNQSNTDKIFGNGLGLGRGRGRMGRGLEQQNRFRGGFF